MASLLLSIFLLSPCANSVALPARDTSTCQAIANLGVNVWFDPPNTTTSEYDLEQEHYWSTVCSAIRPACIITPSTTDEVSTIVTTLRDNHSRFAIKGAGHNPNQGWASIADAPVISTRNFNHVIYDNKTNTVRVGSGNRWVNVIEALESLGLTVSGGRVGDVGVGGYLLGGGLGYLSSQYGWAANGLVGVEMVLPNGTFIKASIESQPELLLALRGGGNNFGIITTFVLKARSIGKVWAGLLVYNKVDDSRPFLSAVASFTRNYDAHPKAALEANPMFNATTKTVSWIIFVFFDGTDPHGAFDEFLSLKPDTNTVSVRAYSDFLKSNSQLLQPGFVNAMGTHMTPLPSEEHTVEVFQSYFGNWLSIVQGLAHLPGFNSIMPLQPIPRLLARKARQEGGDLIDLDDELDRIIVAFVLTYVSDTGDAQADASMKALISGTADRVANFTAEGILPEAYLPVFMNDQYYSQDYWGSLRPEMRQLGQKVQEEVDADGFFKMYTSGPKI